MTGGRTLWGGEYCGGGVAYFGGGCNWKDTVGGGCRSACVVFVVMKLLLIQSLS